MEDLTFLKNKTIALDGLPRNSPVGRILGLKEASVVIENETEQFKADFLVCQGDALVQPSETFVKFLAAGKPILHVSSLIADPKAARVPSQAPEDYLLGEDRKRRLKGYGEQAPQTVKAPRLSYGRSQKPLLTNWVVLLNMPHSPERGRLVRILESGGATISQRSLTAFANNYVMRKMMPDADFKSSAKLDHKRVTNGAASKHEDMSTTEFARTILRFIISDKAIQKFTLGEYLQLKRATADSAAHLYIVPPTFVEKALRNVFNNPVRDSYLDFSMREVAHELTLDNLTQIKNSLNFTQLDRGLQFNNLIDRVFQAQQEQQAAEEGNSASVESDKVECSDIYLAPQFLEDLLLWWTKYMSEKPAFELDRIQNREKFKVYFRALLDIVNARYSMASGMPTESIVDHLFGSEANLSLLEKSRLMLQNAKNCLAKLPKTTKDNKTVLQTSIRLLIPTFFDTIDDADNRAHHLATLECVAAAWVTDPQSQGHQWLLSVMIDHLADVFIDEGLPPGVKTAMNSMSFHVYLLLVLDFVAIVSHMRSTLWLTSPTLWTPDADDAKASCIDEVASSAPATGGSSSNTGDATTAVHAHLPLVLHFLVKDGPQFVQPRLALFVSKFRELMIIINEQLARAAAQADDAPPVSQQQQQHPAAGTVAELDSPLCKFLLVFVGQIFSLVCEALRIWPLLPQHVARMMPPVVPWTPLQQQQPASSTAASSKSIASDHMSTPPVKPKSLVAAVAYAFFDVGDPLRNEQYLKQPLTCDALLSHLYSPTVKYVLARLMLDKFFAHEYSVPSTTLSILELAKHVMKLPNLEAALVAGVNDDDDDAHRHVVTVAKHTRLMRLSISVYQ